MFHRGSLIRQLAPERNQVYIFLVYVFWKQHAHFLQNVCSWMGWVIEFCRVAIPIRLSKVEASPEMCWLRNYYWLHANTNGAMLCVCGIGSMTDILHMFAMLSDAK